MELEEDKDTSVVVTDEPEPDFETLAAEVLANAGIVPANRIQAERLAQADHKAAAFWLGNHVWLRPKMTNCV